MMNRMMRAGVLVVSWSAAGCLFLESPSTPSNNTPNNQPNNTNNQPNNDPCSAVARPAPPECEGDILVTYVWDEVGCALIETREDCSEFEGVCVAGECQAELLCANLLLEEDACEAGLAYLDENGTCVIDDCAATGGVCDENNFCNACKSWTNDSCGICEDGAAPAPCAGDQGETCIEEVGCVQETCMLGFGMPGMLCGAGLRCHMTSDRGVGYCAPPCEADMECEEGFHCKIGGLVSGLCVGCIRDQDCAGGMMCDQGSCK